MIMLLLVTSCGKIECQNGVITDVYHVPSLSANLLYTPTKSDLKEGRILSKIGLL
jgi:hypothetical protein